MFHVSAPTMIYKHWLSASLKYLFKETQQILANSYSIYLGKIAKAYMKDRYLSINPKEYHEIIIQIMEKVRMIILIMNI